MMGGVSALMIGTTGCGIEAFFHEIFDTEHEPDLTVLQGTMTNMPTEMFVVAADGNVLIPDPDAARIDVTEGTFRLEFEPLSLDNALLVAVEGERVLRLMVPKIAPLSVLDGPVSGLAISEESTAHVTIIEASMSAQLKTRQNVDATLMGDIVRLLPETDETQTVVDMVTEIMMSADPDGTDDPLVTPEYELDEDTGEYIVTTSALYEPWWATNGSGLSFSDEDFDAAVAASAQEVNVIGCLDPDNIRVVLEVDNTPGRIRGDGVVLSQPLSGWVASDPGDFMHFVGGVHEESEIQNSGLDTQMGNNGTAWVPNSVVMYDDGTNGDAEAGDGIWTVSFIMPRGVRVGYKFTWGLTGERWTGTEEWPGNQRILEVIDVNGDGFVYRRDAFGDEHSNKDKGNLKCGEITWDTDCNGDGLPEAWERQYNQIRTTNPEEWEWRPPQGIGPALLDVPLDQCPTAP
jgi:hypothetical protein